MVIYKYCNVCYNIDMTYEKPLVPVELHHMLDDEVLAVHERHANRSYDQLRTITNELEDTCLSDGGDGLSRAIVIANKGADLEAGVSIYPFAYQQAWKPSWAARLHFYHDVVNPDGLTIALPNNSGKKTYFDFTSDDLATLNSGDMRPLYEKHIRTVTALLGTTAIGPVSIVGYSQGGLVALGMASVESDLPIASVHAFEAPSAERTPKQLEKDFMKSGGPKDQLAAIGDAALPALDSAFRLHRICADYGRFFLDSLHKSNKAQMTAMATPNIDVLVEKALNDGTTDVVLGYVEGSRMQGSYQPTERDGLRQIIISEGAGSHKHATGDNIVANALMMSY